jgi:hypothetical protein
MKILSVNFPKTLKDQNKILYINYVYNKNEK